MAFGAQPDMQTAIPKPTLLGRQFSQATPKLFVPRTPGTVANSLPIGVYGDTPGARLSRKSRRRASPFF
jgi:hypothetical protein